MQWLPAYHSLITGLTLPLSTPNMQSVPTCTVPKIIWISAQKPSLSHGWGGSNGRYLAFIYKYLAQKSGIYRCICSNRDRLGFYAKIQIIFGTVCTFLHIMLKLVWVIFSKIRTNVASLSPRLHWNTGSFLLTYQIVVFLFIL